MKETACQNAASSPPLCSQGSMSSTQTSQSLDRSSALSSKQLTADMPEMFQNREVLLKMLQPPALYLSSSGCSLPYQEEAKKCSNSDGSHCFRCINFKPPHISPAPLTTEATEQSGILKTRNGICVPGPNTGDRRRTEANITQSPSNLETDMNLTCKQDLSKKKPEKTRLLFPTAACCPTCERNLRTFPHEKFCLRTAHSQRNPTDGQKHFNTEDYFQKETLPNDRSWLPLAYHGGQIKDITPENSSSRSTRKGGCGFNEAFLPNGHYYRFNLSTDQPPTSNKGKGGHRDMETSSDEGPDHPLENRVNGLSYRLREKSIINIPFTTQENQSEDTPAVWQGPDYATSRPLQGSLDYEHHEERNKRFATTSGKQSDACSCFPDDSSREECTPIILHCYSLSEPRSRGDSQNMQGYTGRKDELWFPDRHTQCVRKEPPLNWRISDKRLRSDEKFEYNTSAFYPGSSPYAHNQRVISRPNEHLIAHVSVNDERRQNASVSISPGRVYRKSSSRAECHCANCPSYRCSQETEQMNSRCNEKLAESSSLIHVPSGFHKAHNLQDRQTGVETEPEAVSNYKQMVNSQRATLKIRDYYEERRILVEQFYPNIPDSAEETQSGKGLHISYARKGDGFHENDRQSHPSSTDLYQIPTFENIPFHTRVHQQDFFVGSKKRKNRQPRPQRARDDDSTQFASLEGEHDHFKDNQLEETCENRSHPQANLTSPHDKSIRDKGSPKIRDLGVRSVENLKSSCEDASATVPSHGWIRRCDFISNTPSKSPICRNVTPQDTKSPCEPSHKGWKTAETQRGQTRNVPSFDMISSEHSPSSQLLFVHEKSAYHQFKPPKPNFRMTYGNVTKHPGYLRSEWKEGPQHLYAPARLEVSKIHLEKLEKRRRDFDSVQQMCLSPMQVAFGPPHINAPREGGEVDSEKPCNEETMLGYAERCAMPAKDRSQKDDSDASSSSLTSDQSVVTSTTRKVSDELQKPQNTERPVQLNEVHTPTTKTKKHTEEQHFNFSESQDLFLKNREVFGNFMSSSMKERRFVCRFCCKKFAHFSTLQNHVRTHTGDKPFQCKFCSRRFAQSGVLKAHLRTHTGDKPFVCMYCGKMFAQSTTLTNHLRTHTGQKPYVCHYCGKSFSQPSTLRKHELSHTKERPYSCKFCGKAFAQQSTLTNHMRSHTGQRPYKCHFCDKSFAQLSTLDRHLRLHSSVSLKPHQCQYCSKSFSYFSNLATHMQLHEQGQFSKAI